MSNNMSNNMSHIKCGEQPPQCYIFKHNKEPKCKYGKRNLNNIRKHNNVSKFTNVERSACGTRGVTSKFDGSLVSVGHGGERTVLNKPPLDGSVDWNTVNDLEYLNNYGQNYENYSDVEPGQITYYTDKSREDAFYQPLFTRQVETMGYLYTDPMDSVKAQYIRLPLPEDSLEKKCKYEGGLSWIQDSTNHREDMLALQMEKTNRSRWMPRWTNLRVQD